MQTKILQSVEVVWEQHCAQLKETLAQHMRQLRELVRVDEYHRHGHKEEILQEALGPFGANHLNTGALADVLSGARPSPKMSSDRRARIESLLEELDATRATCSEFADACAWIDLEEAEESIHARAEEHLTRLTKVFQVLRRAQLEVRAKYIPSEHDALFANFSWRVLSPNELRLCPPFLVLAHLDGQHGPLLRKAMALLESRKPFKVALLRSRLAKGLAPNDEPIVPANLSIEMMPLALRGAYFVQSCVADPGFENHLFAALTSPRPSVVSLLCPVPEEDTRTFHRRAEHAVRSRAFPLCLYDPDRSDRFVQCMDLDHNPAPEATWAPPEGASNDIAPGRLEAPPVYTFAHFAAEEAQFSDEFTPPDEEQRAFYTPLVEYLRLNRRQRVGRIPTIKVRDNSADTVERVVSSTVVAQTLDRMHLWRTLQEIAGVNNPHIQSTRSLLEYQFGVQRQRDKEETEEKQERLMRERERAAVANAVQKLVAHFTGVEPSQITLNGQRAKSSD